MAFGDKVLELLEQREVSQKEFAKSLNIAPTTLNGYIKNKRQPDFETVKSMAFILNVSTDYLLEYSKSGMTFTIEELSLIEKMRKMSSEQQQIILDLANCIIKNNKTK